ncbi:MAG: glycosyltransferase family 9 protein [bacterium]
MKKKRNKKLEQPIQRILIIVRRANGDVLLTSPLINMLFQHFVSPQIDLLINDDTAAIAQRLENVNHVHQYSYQWKKLGWWSRFRKNISLISSVFRQYDLSISLTATDSSVLYALLAGKLSVSFVEHESKKSWWKKLFLDNAYTFSVNQHVIENHRKVLECLNISDSDQESTRFGLAASEEGKRAIVEKLNHLGVSRFLIFHASAQYRYKLYPESLRNELLTRLGQLDMPIFVTGGRSELDQQIKASLPSWRYVYDFIGETSLDEYIALSDLSTGYIGADTLNMHIAAAQGKPIFSWFGPTLSRVWSPWSLDSKSSAHQDGGIHKYGKVTLFQANLPCVPCGKAGCDDRQGHSDCLDHIKPVDVAREVKNYFDSDGGL